jgi:D-alanine--poly(phosphoribitol) ligase subunit 2
MPGRTIDEIVGALVGFVNTEIMAPGHAIGPIDRFEPAGVDSMALLRILVFIEQEFGVWMPDEDLVAGNVASPIALGRYVAERLSPG